MVVAKTLKFSKMQNGTVLLQKTQDNSVVASFEPSMSLKREDGDDNRFRIASSTSENGFLVDYRSVDCGVCSPVIIQENFTDFLIALSRDFFFLAKATSSLIIKEGDLLVFKRAGNTDNTKIEVKDFAMGVVEGQYIRGTYKGGAIVLASFDIFDRIEF